MMKIVIVSQLLLYVRISINILNNPYNESQITTSLCSTVKMANYIVPCATQGFEIRTVQ